MKLGKRKYEKPSIIPKKVKYMIQFCEDENPHFSILSEKKLISCSSETIGDFSKTNEELGKLWTFRTDWDTLNKKPMKKNETKTQPVDIINDDLEEYVIGETANEFDIDEFEELTIKDDK